MRSRSGAFRFWGAAKLAKVFCARRKLLERARLVRKSARQSSASLNYLINLRLCVGLFMRRLCRFGAGMRLESRERKLRPPQQRVCCAARHTRKTRRRRRRRRKRLPIKFLLGFCAIGAARKLAINCQLAAAATAAKRRPAPQPQPAPGKPLARR